MENKGGGIGVKRREDGEWGMAAGKKREENE